MAERRPGSRPWGRASGSPGPAVPAGSEDVADLVRRAQDGDREAFGLLYDRSVDTVFRFVAYRVSSRQLAEDLTGEAFLRALRRIDSFTWQGHDIDAWFITIARNLITDHYKSAKARLEVVVEDATAGTSHPLADSPETAVLTLLRDEQLHLAVRALPAEQGECIQLRFLSGLSVAETARVMGKGEGAVKAMQYRAVQALARRLTQDPSVPEPGAARRRRSGS